MCMIYKSHKMIRKPITVYAVRIKVDDNFCKSPFQGLLWQLGVERIEEDDAKNMSFYDGMEISEGFFHVMKSRLAAAKLALDIEECCGTHDLAVYECEVSSGSFLIDGYIPLWTIGNGMKCYCVTRLKVVKLVRG
jgi:hypothetical protein